MRFGEKRVLMKRAFVGLAVFSLLVLVSCTKKDDAGKAAASGSDKPAAAVAAAAGTGCPGGAKLEIVKGKCQGAYRVGKDTNGGTTCEFDWGPAIRCPAGMKAMGSEAACYGTTVRPADKSIQSAKDCSGKFGEVPQSADYELHCCAT